MAAAAMGCFTHPQIWTIQSDVRSTEQSEKRTTGC